MSWAFRRRSSTGWGKERMKKWSIGNLWKKYKYVGLVVLAGIVLMVLPAGTSAPDPQKDSGGFSLEDTERRMEELRLSLRSTEDPECTRQLRRRLLELQPLLRQCRQLAQVTAHYYDRSDRSHDASRL